MSLESTRGLSRMNYKTTSEGWLARYTREGATFGKMFADQVYGSPEAAKQAAQAWHKDIRSLFPPMDYDEWFDTVGSRSKSGMRGIRRVVQIVKGHEYPVWTATWKLGEKRTHRSFSINKYGEDGARDMAIAARKAIEPELRKHWEETYWNYRPRSFSEMGYVEEPFAFEGDRHFVLHHAVERDRSLRQRKVEAFLAEHGTLFCEVCGFSFEKAYGELGRGLIEIHHLIPMAELSAERKTRISELMCICSNCHFTVHNGDPAENLRLMTMIFKDVTRTKNKKD